MRLTAILAFALALAVAAIATAVATGNPDLSSSNSGVPPKIAALERSPRSSDAIPQAAQTIAAPSKVDFSSSRAVLHDAAGIDAYVVRRGSDEMCLLTVENSGDVGVGCNSLSDFTGRRGMALVVSLGANTPDSTATIVGVAAATVARVSARLPDSALVTPNADGGFVLRTTASAVHGGQVSLAATTAEGSPLEAVKLERH